MSSLEKRSPCSDIRKILRLTRFEGNDPIIVDVTQSALTFKISKFGQDRRASKSASEQLGSISKIVLQLVTASQTKDDNSVTSLGKNLTLKQNF